MIWDWIFMDIFKIKSQIKSPYFNMILKISKSSKNDLKSDFVKSSIKSLNTLVLVWFNVTFLQLKAKRNMFIVSKFVASQIEICISGKVSSDLPHPVMALQHSAHSIAHILLLPISTPFCDILKEGCLDITPKCGSIQGRKRNSHIYRLVEVCTK
jgi:hypothetical protein